jgi:hypothetical protein
MATLGAVIASPGALRSPSPSAAGASPAASPSSSPSGGPSPEASPSPDDSKREARGGLRGQRLGQQRAAGRAGQQDLFLNTVAWLAQDRPHLHPRASWTTNAWC